MYNFLKLYYSMVGLSHLVKSNRGYVVTFLFFINKYYFGINIFYKIFDWAIYR